MDKYLTRSNEHDSGGNVATPSRKRTPEDAEKLDTTKKKNKLDDTLLNDNYYSPLTNIMTIVT